MNTLEQEIVDYISALNAHAIVAITNQHGVIIQANDRFCEISKYTQEELCGNTHRIINSGYHPDSFFEGLWNSISQGNIWQGEMCNRAKDGLVYWVCSTIVPFLGDDGKPAKYIAIQADLTKPKQVEQENQLLSRQDCLYNRRKLGARFLEAQTDSVLNEQYCALLSIDLDGFKRLNDYFDSGDKLLVELASRLTQHFRPSDTVARMEGDKFLIILTELGGHYDLAVQHVVNVGERIMNAMAAPYFVFDTEYGASRAKNSISISGSIGARVFLGDYISMDELLVQADIALYEARNNGKNQLVFHNSFQDQRDEMHENISLEISLRSALEKEELHLQYQPIVDQSCYKLGMEALLRWRSAEYGLVAPAKFIPLAEKMGLIGSIGAWVLKTACQQLAEWSNNSETAAWSLSVNVSALQLNSPSFRDELINLLKCTKIAPNRLILEVTENIFLNSERKCVQAGINLLREYGVGIAIDDFGTGYSSLSYLRNLPITRIKIDRSFITELVHSKKDQGIVKAILALGTALDLQVVAEGVETAEQFHYLQELGCCLFQGYFFGRPEDIIFYTDALQ